MHIAAVDTRPDLQECMNGPPKKLEEECPRMTRKEINYKDDVGQLAARNSNNAAPISLGSVVP